MRWKTRKTKTPSPRDTKSVHGFLLCPKRIGDEFRWLEHTTWIEQYTDIGPHLNVFGQETISRDYEWWAIKWVT